MEAFETKPTNIQLLNTTLSFAKRQGYYLDCKMKPNYLNKEIYNKPTLELTLLTPLLELKLLRLALLPLLALLLTMSVCSNLN